MQLKSVKSGAKVSMRASTGTVVPIKTKTGATIQRGKSPYIDLDTNTWWEYDDEQQKFVDTGYTATFIVDTELSDTSTNPVQNKVITKEVNGKLDDDDINELKAIDIDVLWETL